MAIFDKEAVNYDVWYKTKFGSFIDKVETDLCLNLFKVDKNIRVLDIGCGTGNFSIKLAKMGCKVTAIDISDEMLKIAKEKAKNEGLDIEFHNMDLYNLEFEDGYFDAVFSMAAFEFVKESQKAINEIFRVVKESGKILIGTINKDSKWGELYLSEEFQKNTVFKYADFKTIEDLKRLNSDKLLDTGECLFIPPTSEETDINIDKEKELSKTERGGFICALWKK